MECVFRRDYSQSTALRRDYVTGVPGPRIKTTSRIECPACAKDQKNVRELTRHIKRKENEAHRQFREKVVNSICLFCNHRSENPISAGIHARACLNSDKRLKVSSGQRNEHNLHPPSTKIPTPIAFTNILAEHSEPLRWDEVSWTVSDSTPNLVSWDQSPWLNSPSVPNELLWELDQWYTNPTGPAEPPAEQIFWTISQETTSNDICGLLSSDDIDWGCAVSAPA